VVEENSKRIFDPCFSCEKVKTIFRKQKLNVLDRPGGSPDLNPIENVVINNKTSVTKIRLHPNHQANRGHHSNMVSGQ